MSLQLPALFVERMKLQLADEADAFFASLDQSPRTSVRLHHEKGKINFPLATAIPWCADGYYLEKRPFFHIDPLWHASTYYVQESSSMILDEVLRQLPEPPQHSIWIDLCAAPGGKTGILAKHVPEDGVLIANEVIRQRRNILNENLTKAGYKNVFLSGENATQFPASIADVILLDAPCAGEGMMRKDDEAVSQWTPQLVDACAHTQSQLLQEALRMLKPDGILIYSTCSYSEAENMQNIIRCVNEKHAVSRSFSFPDAWKISKMEVQDAIGYQLYPHRVPGEGLFIAVLQKQDQFQETKLKAVKKRHPSLPAASSSFDLIDATETYAIHRHENTIKCFNKKLETTIEKVTQWIPRATWMVVLGEVKGRDIIPHHFLAMSGMASQSFGRIGLNIESALDFLERKIPNDLPDSHNGWHLVTFEDIELGWLKKTAQGWKNHYPMDWRLRHRIPLHKGYQAQ